MSLTSQKAGPNFGTATGATVKPNTPEYFARLIVRAAKQLGMTPTVKLVTEGLGTIDAEGGFDGSLWRNNPDHPGPWALGSSYGSLAERLDPWKSTLLAMEDRKSNGSFYNSWWKFEDEQGEIEDGKARAKKYKKIAEAAGAGGSNPSLGEEIPLVGGIIGDAEGAVEGAMDAGAFLAEMAETLLDFRKLGHLAVSAFAWFLRLLIKAIWDYVIAPMWHWAERAETWYWRNFFGTGTEQGSGLGFQLRQNAGIITIGFWAIGYAVLWTDGTSLSPTESHESMFGRAVKGVEGQVARRNLVKPKDVERETPNKPKPKASTVQIERVKEYSVNRRRPVTVGIPGGSEDIKGRNNDGHSERQGHQVPRPKKGQNEEIVKVPERRVKTHPRRSETAAESGPGSASRTDSGDRTKGDRSPSAAARDQVGHGGSEKG